MADNFLNKTINGWTFNQKIGRKVYQCRNEKAVRSAIKVVDASEIDSKIFSLIENFNCPYLVKYLAIFTNAIYPNNYFFVMDILNKDLKKSIDDSITAQAHSPPSEILKRFAEISIGLFYLHDNSLPHCNLKPENILLSGQDSLKLSDFGMTTRTCDSMIALCRQSPQYTPPEITKRGQITLATDIYSVASIVYTLITHSNFDGRTMSLPPKIVESLPGDLPPLLCSMLSENPQARPTIRDVVLSPSVRRAIAALPIPAVSLPPALNTLYTSVPLAAEVPPAQASLWANATVASAAASPVRNLAGSLSNLPLPPIPGPSSSPPPSGANLKKGSFLSGLFKKKGGPGVKPPSSVTNWGDDDFEVLDIVEGTSTTVVPAFSKTSASPAFHGVQLASTLSSSGIPAPGLTQSLPIVPGTVPSGATPLPTPAPPAPAPAPPMATPRVSTSPSPSPVSRVPQPTAPPVSSPPKPTPSPPSPSLSSASSSSSLSSVKKGKPKEVEREEEEKQGPMLKYVPNSFGGYILQGEDELDVLFQGGELRSVFYDYPIRSGIWRLTVIVSVYTNLCFTIGVTPPKDVPDTLDNVIGYYINTGCGYALYVDNARIDNNDETSISIPDFRGVNGAPVSVEVNMTNHTMNFFNDEILLPYTITNIPDTLVFGFSSYEGRHNVRFVALDQLPCSTLSAMPVTVQCRPVKWGVVNFDGPPAF